MDPMPQLTIDPDLVPTLHGVRIEAVMPPTALHSLQFNVYVRRAEKGDYMPVYSTFLPGIESDFLMTITKEVMAAWAYGEGVRDVQIAASGVKRQAKAHREAHEF